MHYATFISVLLHYANATTRFAIWKFRFTTIADYFQKRMEDCLAVTMSCIRGSEKTNDVRKKDTDSIREFANT